MIARILVILLLAIILPEAYLDRHFLRRRSRYLPIQRILWWLPSVALCAYTIVLAASRDFAPGNMTLLNAYLLLIGVLIVPKAVFAVSSCIGWLCCRLAKRRTNWGTLIGFLFAVAIAAVTVYGSTAGFRKLDVNRVDYYSDDLPREFDGYRIVHFSDLHLGTYAGKERMVERIVDSINAQKPDMIAFTGDLENMRPEEVYPFRATLAGLKARDGVYSVLGNHDYAGYIDADDVVKVANERELMGLERQFGWNLLLNESRTITREGGGSMAIAGMENDGMPPFPERGDIAKALSGVREGSFVIMLEHDPTAWRRVILPESDVQLTLSGHTHATQFKVFGWSPASLVYREWGGMYHEGNRALCVSIGAGGFIPFRFGASNEIVVITLHSGRPG